MEQILTKNNLLITYDLINDDFEIDEVIRLAKFIWPRVYLEFLTKDHVDYLLAKYFSREAIKQNIEDNYLYYLFKDNEKNIGFATIIQQEGNVYIDKLYLLNEYRNLKIGKTFLLKAHEIYKKPLKLNVNMLNLSAIFAYGKIGFHIEDVVSIKFNNEFVNEDFVMIYK